MAKRARILPVTAAMLVAASLGGCATFPGGGVHLTERECMARVMFFESKRSSDDGMLAVGTVVMNRVESGKYPGNVCGVVGQRNQFAEGALTNHVNKRHSSWARAERAADAVLAGARHDGVGGAKFFHTAGHSFPYGNMRYVTLAGGNIFYEKRYPSPGAPAWPSSTMFAAATKRGAEPRPVMLAQADDEAAFERPRRAPGASAPSRPIVVARMEESGIERPYGTPVAYRARPAARALAEDSAIERPYAAPTPLRPRSEPQPILLASAPRPTPAINAPMREPAGPLVLASAPPVAARPKPVVAVAIAPPPPKPIVVAMLAEPKTRAWSPRTIAEIIAMDEKRR